MKDLKNEWGEWSMKIIELSKLEAKSCPVIRKLVDDLDGATNSSLYSERGMLDIYIIISNWSPPSIT